MEEQKVFLQLIYSDCSGPPLEPLLWRYVHAKPCLLNRVIVPVRKNEVQIFAGQILPSELKLKLKLDRYRIERVSKINLLFYFL